MGKRSCLTIARISVRARFVEERRRLGGENDEKNGAVEGLKRITRGDSGEEGWHGDWPARRGDPHAEWGHAKETLTSERE